MRVLNFGALIVTMVATYPACAASLLTQASGYTGPVLDLSAYPDFFDQTPGPVSLPGGITYSAGGSNAYAIIGSASYGFGVNGGSYSGRGLIGTNDGSASGTFVTLTFDTPVATFGGGFNYAPSGFGADYDAPIIAAYDSNGDLIASYDLAALAPINAFGLNDVFLFRGIDGGGTAIKSFTLSGSYIAIAAGAVIDPPASVPEPASWALLVAGFGMVGVTLRRQRPKTA